MYLPLKLRDFESRGQVSVLNKWAESVTTALNSLKSGVSYATNKAAPAAIVVPPSKGDGLIHGRSPWEGDPAAVVLEDDFVSGGTGYNGTGPASNIGELEWLSIGTAPLLSIVGGTPPNLGSVQWYSNNAASSSAMLMLSGGGANVNNIGVWGSSWALFDNVDWILTWVFRFVPHYYSSGAVFDTTQKAIYIGLGGVTTPGLIATTSISRPDTFYGLRYDTSTSGAGINDTNMTFEAVQNQTTTSPARNNTQGLTQVTTLVPDANNWHRLDMVCTSSGLLTMVLDGSPANTFNVTLSPFTMTPAGGIGAFLFGTTPNCAEITWLSSLLGFWGMGSKITLAGFVTKTVCNGTFSWQNPSEAIGFIDLPVSAGSGSDSSGVTISGYPAVVPVVILGNDDTASPTYESMGIQVDYFSLVWNPGLNPTNSLKPTNTKARYW